MKPSISKQLLDKFLKGKCTAEEEEAVLAWYNAFESEKDYLPALHGEKEIEMREQIFQLVSEKAGLPREKRSGMNKRKLATYILRGVAAMAIIAIGVAYFKVRTDLQHKHTAAAQNMMLVNNTTNRIIDQALSDGSHVWLKPGAQLKFAKKFTGTTRDVFMVGEAFFEVKKNAGKPFIVHSSNIITKVWGTSFRVRDSKSISFADVTVVTGKVSVKLKTNLSAGRGSKEILLYPDNQAVYSKQKKTLIADEVTDVKPLKMWKRVDLSFDNAPLPEVVNVLNKHFNSNIELGNQALNKFTINVNLTGLNLPEVMTILCKTLAISYKMDGDKIIIQQTNN
ncbi:hypothetical protein DJ568_00185 [Mucilaginibacter hurinus]|uniref:FecR family protein n=1 Tax=Mucilaginibacter hurinus TaxID=2201324 RepID=A0A367GT26_9SPHI|nr:FecR family protein [Mucilaginibacter hurinus]RCH56318.1 hypothetical protein DJ568_00185 [Mucilaginibacter hurinus]